MGWLTYEQPEVVFPEGTVFRKPPHRDFPIRRGGNRSWIVEITIFSATSIPLPHLTVGLQTKHVCYSVQYSEIAHFELMFLFCNFWEFQGP